MKEYVLTLGFSAHELMNIAQLALCVTLVALAHVVVTGWSLKSRTDKSPLAHVAFVVLFLISLLVTVVGIEVLVQLHGGLWVTGLMWWTHFLLVLATIALLTVTLLKHGRKSEYHGKYAYSFAGSLVLLAVTGELMLLRYPLI